MSRQLPSHVLACHGCPQLNSGVARFSFGTRFSFDFIVGSTRSMTRISIFAALFAVAIPWYWRWFPELAEYLVVGLPTWFVVAVVGSLAISIYTAWNFRKPWPMESTDSDEVSRS